MASEFFHRFIASVAAGRRAPSDLPPQPQRTVYAVGDIHGRRDLLERMLALIDADKADTGADDAALIFLGDMVDRGPDSAGVLGTIHRMMAARPDDVLCLCGNHEDMMLQFLCAPTEVGSGWLLQGGLETLGSFGILGAEAGTSATAVAAAAELEKALAERGLLQWLRTLPTSWQSGTLFAAHAGADPRRALTDQPRQVLLWGHRAFGRVARQDGIWVVHGHTIVQAPFAAAGCIAVDTGAVFSGRLSAAAIAPDGDLRFLTT